MVVDETNQSTTLLPNNEPTSLKFKFKIITCEKTKKWLESYIVQQAARDEIMFYGSSNINESVNNMYTVKADKRHDFRCSYTARVDVAAVEFMLKGKSSLYEKICNDFACIEISEETRSQLRKWDEERKNESTRKKTANAKRKRIEGKARKTRLLRRATLRAGAYTYVTSDERAAVEEKMEAGQDDAEIETVTDIE